MAADSRMPANHLTPSVPKGKTSVITLTAGYKTPFFDEIRAS